MPSPLRTLVRPVLRTLLALLAVLVVGALPGVPTARAAMDPLCGTTITAATHPTLTVTLTQDLDCSGLTTNALTIGVSGVTIDGGPQRFKIIAPDAARAITSTGFSNVTIKNTEVSGWCGGIGIYLDGGSGHTVDNVRINARATGLDARNTTNLSLSRLTIDSAATSGITLTNLALTAPTQLTLRDLTLTNNLTGLTLTNVSGTSTSTYTFAPYVALSDTGAITSLLGNTNGIVVAGSSYLRFQGLRIDGSTYGIDAGTATTNTFLTFDGVDLSSTGIGTGLYLTGANHTVLDTTSNRRNIGLRALTTTNLTVRRLHASGAAGSSGSGLSIESPTLPLTLENLDLQNNTRAFYLSGLTATLATPYPITAYDSGTGAIGSLAGSLTGLEIATSKYLRVHNLTLDNPSYAIKADNASNDTITFENLNVSGKRQTGAGLYLGGKNITVQTVTANRRQYGVQAAAVTNLIVNALTATGNNTGLFLQSFTATHSPCTLNGLTLTNNGSGLYFASWSMPFTVRNTPGDSQSINLAGSLTGIGVQSSSNLTFNDLTLDNRAVGIDAYPSNTSSTSLTFNRVNASGNGTGIGIRAGGASHTLNTVTANDRDTGVVLYGPSALSITTLVAKRNRTQGLSLESLSAGTAPVLSGLDLRDNGIGFNINNWSLAMVVRNTPGDSQSLDVSGSDTGIYVGNSANITFRDLTLANPTAAITAWHSSRATSNSNMRFENLTLSGTRGSGYGLQLGGANHVLDNVIADNRSTGLYLASTDNLVMDRVFARNNATAVAIQSITTATWTGPTLGRMTLTNNSTALDLRSITRPFNVGPATVGDTAGAITFAGSLTGIYATGLSGTTFRNLTLANPTLGFNGSDANNAALTFTNVDVSGVGLGTGLQLGRDANYKAGADHVLIDVKANHRSTGIHVAYASNLTLTRPIADQCDTGILINLPFDAAASPPTITQLRSRSSRIGFALRWNNAWTVNLANLGLDLAGSTIGIELVSSSNLTLDGANTPQNVRLDNLVNGILANNSNTSLTFKNLDLSGNGLGKGLVLSGTGHTIQDVTANDRETGFDLATTTNPVLTRLRATRNGTALSLTSTTITTAFAPSGLDLTHSTTGLNIATMTLSGVGASYAMGPSNFAALGGSPTAIKVTSAPAVTYDTAGLTSTFGLTNPSAGTFANTLVSGSALCGTTLTALTHPSLTLTLTADLDCSGVTGTALTIGADDFTIDGAGPGGVRYKIIAPNAATVIAASNKNRVRIKNLDLSGARVSGTGLSIDGGTGHLIDNVDVSRRATGADLRNTSDLGVNALTANWTSTTGLYLRSITLPLSMTGLTATNGNGTGLKLYGINGAAGAPNGIDDLTFTSANITSLAGQSVSIQLENLVTRVTFDGLSGLDGRSVGLDVVAGNTACTFKNLDTSMLRGAGTGVQLRGDGHTLDTVIANRRATGFDLMTGTGLSVRSPLAAGASTTALKIGGTGALTLTAAELTSSATALAVEGLVGTAGSRYLIDRWTVANPTGALKSVTDSLNGVSVNTTTAYVDFANLVLPNPSNAFNINNTTSNLRLTSIDVSGDRFVGNGLQIRGASQSAIGITADNRSIGVYANSASGLVLTSVLARHNSTRGLHLQGWAPALAAPTLNTWTLTDNAIGLHFETWTRPVTVDASWGFDVSGSATGITVSATSTGLTFSGLTLANPTNGIDAADASNTGLTFTNLIVDGPGRGNGLSLRGTGHTISGGRADHRGTGITTGNVGGISVTGFTARYCTYGIGLLSTTAGAAPTLSNLTLTDNDSGLYLDGWTVPFTLRATDLVNVQRSLNGLRVLRTTDVTFEGLVLDNPTNGFSGGDSNGGNARLTFTGVDASGVGIGTGINLSYDGHTLTNVKANDRDTGFYFNRTGGLQANGLEAARVGTALYAATSGTTAPTWRNLTLTDANMAIRMDSFTTAMTLRNAGANPTNLVTTGSLTGIYLNAVTGLTVEDMSFPNVSRGIQVETGNVSSGLTFRRVNFDGAGIGYGLLGTGQSGTLESITARDRDYGVYASNSPNLTVNGLVVERAATTAFYYDAIAGGAKPTFSNLSLTQSNTGLFVRNITGPWVLDNTALTNVSGNQVSVELNHNVTQTTVRNLTLDGVTTGLSANSSSQNLANVTLENLNVTGYCRGTGISLNGVDQGLDRITAARRGTGISLAFGDRYTITRSVIGANTIGLSLGSVSSIANTTVVADAGNSLSQFKVNDTTNIAVGKTLRVFLSPAEDRVVASVNTTTKIVTFTVPFSTLPPVATVVQGPDYNAIRATLATSDICANGTGSASATQGLTATTDYWRSSLGPRHASNPGCTVPGGCLGDLVTGTAVTLSPFVTVPTDKSNAYCNQAPVADAGAPRTFCEGDTANLDASASYDPDIEPITFAWSQTAGTTVALSSATADAPTFIAPGPYSGQPGATQTLSFEVLVQDDLVRRRATVTHTITRRNYAPVATADPHAAVNEGDTVTLGGSAVDPEARAMTYAWTQTGGPAVVVTGGTTLGPTFTAPQVGPGGGPSTTTLTFELAASDTAPPGYCGGDATGRATVQVIVNNVNRAPTADAGDDRTVPEETLVTLDGTASQDPDGDGLTYAWTQVSGPAVTLSAANVATPTFTSPSLPQRTSATLVFALVVSDAYGGVSSVSTVTLQVDDVCHVTGDDTDCDGLDDDCDGLDDNHYTVDTTCFRQGVCATGNVASSCAAGGVETLCATGAPSGVAESVCNGADDDCDGAVDEDYLPDTTCFRVGACAAGNVASRCQAGVVTACQTGIAAASDATCDGVDDDCSGAADEDFVGVATSCGLGVCVATGTTTCVGGVPGDSCVPLPSVSPSPPGTLEGSRSRKA